MKNRKAEKILEITRRNLEDPITKFLLKKSGLTNAQFETFLIDFLAKTYNVKPVNVNTGKRVRVEGEVSRGAFNRTKKQALNNIIQSIYTILLLGYTGVFDSPQFDFFTELADKIKAYIEASEEKREEKYLEVMEMLRANLEEKLKNSIK